MKTHVRAILGLAAMVTVVTTATLMAHFQDKPETPPAGAGGMPDLAAGLKETPGCLGVETARTRSGKNVIFAWFEDKNAVKQWYYSKMHRGVMKDLMNTKSDRKPLEHVKDDAGPIMVIASITYASKPKLKSVKLPISQISIELYQPLPGGAYIGGRFAPKRVPVEEMRALDD